MTLETFILIFKSESVTLVLPFVKRFLKLQESHAMQIHPTKKTEYFLFHIKFTTLAGPLHR